MNPLDYYTGAFKKFAQFTGRARRSEYWYFVLFNMLASLATFGVDMVIGSPILNSIYGLVALVPGLAVFARRMHDSGRSAWWLLIALTGIGVFVLLYFLVQDSEPGENKWGLNPKDSHAIADDLADHLVE